MKAQNVYRLIAPDWLIRENPTLSKVIEGIFSDSEIKDYNVLGYNIYYFPNHPSNYKVGTSVDGTIIDVFEYVFVDMDLKDAKYLSKDEFIENLSALDLKPTKIIDSGNGIHAYWRVSNLDAMSYLRIQRRLIRYFDTDVAVAKICQLMRVPNTINNKDRDNLKLCKILSKEDTIYSCDDLDKALPVITKEDEDYCLNHFNKTYNVKNSESQVIDILPLKFCRLIKTNKEIRDIWSSSPDDRSKTDWRLGHILFANGFTREEARSVLINTAKALQRAPVHRISYADGIVDKIWLYEQSNIEQKSELKKLSNSVKEILSKGHEVLKGIRFACHPFLDNTEAGFRLGNVIGLVAGSGVGKTTMALNMFLWFTERNPDYDHFFVSLEQPENEIANRWQTATEGNDTLHSKVHILSNYDEDGKFRNLSLDEIKEYILEFQKKTGKKIGTCVIDHIGALKKQNKNGENQAIVDICHQMKSFAIETNTLVVMQSQAPREKAGIGDLELTKDAAYGTVFFESYVDYLLCIWQPLKRVYQEGAPTVMAFKYAKIRHKRQGVDKIQEDVRYQLYFDPKNEKLRELTQEEETAAKFYLAKAANIRKQDRKTEILTYTSVRLETKS